MSQKLVPRKPIVYHIYISCPIGMTIIFFVPPFWDRLFRSRLWMITSPFKWNNHRILTHPQLPVFDGENQEDSNVWVEKTAYPNFGQTQISNVVVYIHSVIRYKWMGHNPGTLVNTKIAGICGCSFPHIWYIILLYGIIDIDPYPYPQCIQKKSSINHSLFLICIPLTISLV